MQSKDDFTLESIFAERDFILCSSFCLGDDFNLYLINELSSF